MAAPIAEKVAQMIGNSATPPVVIGTCLTGKGLSRSKDRERAYCNECLPV